MASENETVADVVKELRDEPLAENGAKPWLHYLADRIEAAHRREVEYARIAASSEQARWDEEIEDKLKVIRELNEVRELNRKCCGENERLNSEVAELRGEMNGILKANASLAADNDRLRSEVAELRKFSKDMRTWFRLYYSCGSDPKSKWWRSCASCRRKRCPIHKWRKALEGANNA